MLAGIAAAGVAGTFLAPAKSFIPAGARRVLPPPGVARLTVATVVLPRPPIIALDMAGARAARPLIETRPISVTSGAESRSPGVVPALVATVEPVPAPAIVAPTVWRAVAALARCSVIARAITIATTAIARAISVTAGIRSAVAEATLPLIA